MIKRKRQVLFRLTEDEYDELAYKAERAGRSVSAFLRLLISEAEIREGPTADVPELIRLTGSGAKNLAVMRYAILTDQNKTKGKTRLTAMLKSGKELKVFSVTDADLKRFCREAQRYGVLYTILKDRERNPERMG